MYLERNKENCLVKRLLVLLKNPEDWHKETRKEDNHSRYLTHKDGVSFNYWYGESGRMYISLANPVKLWFRAWSFNEFRLENKIYKVLKYKNNTISQAAQKEAVKTLKSVVDWSTCN